MQAYTQYPSVKLLCHYVYTVRVLTKTWYDNVYTLINIYHPHPPHTPSTRTYTHDLASAAYEGKSFVLSLLTDDNIHTP